MENKEGASGSPENVDGVASGSKDSVAYTTYQKVLAEAKKAKAELESVRAKEIEREQQALLEQGKFKEGLEGALKKVKELEHALADKDKVYARNIFTKEAKQVALQMGAMPEALDDIVKVGNWSDVTIDQETFTIDSSQLKDAMSRLQKEKPFFFRNSPNPPKTVHPSSGSAQVGDKKSLTELSKEEILAELKRLG